MALWNEALESLDLSDRQQLSNGLDSRETIPRLLQDVREERDIARDRRWKFTKSDGSIIILRDVLEKTLHSISKYAQAVDVAVSTDPLHAAPPWAILRLLLQVCSLKSRQVTVD